ncbi:MAG: 2-hydroxy-acid oxidase [Opitutae bacterium]|nr:2-hydroxy-acid oxidase [Opitutae bacterium]
MRHKLPIEKLGPTGKGMADAVQACVHCGFCLPTCPTYGPLGQEMDSPRGRIALMKECLEESLPLDQALPHLDSCLGCLACETSCPSGVSYRELVGPFREQAEGLRSRSWFNRSRRKLFLRILTRPSLFSLVVKASRLVQPFAKWLPKRMRVMLELLPQRLGSKTSLPERVTPKEKTRARVALVAGCAQQVLEPTIGSATISILVRHGVEVVIPREQICCGALHWHAGEGPTARELAKKNIEVFPADCDAVISNAAGCGSCLQEYPLLLKGDSLEAKACVFSSRVLDLSVFLDELGFIPPPPVSGSLRVAYQDACHLLHGQGVSGAPRRILKAIKGIELVSLADPEICCGSAGIYNVENPDMGNELGINKAIRVKEAGPDIVVSANVGCISQLRRHLAQESQNSKVMHLAEFIERAYNGSLAR